ncbi:hypothetical protein V6Z12_A04G079700 [Gossypium hirsutum]
MRGSKFFMYRHDEIFHLEKFCHRSLAGSPSLVTI